MAECPSGRYLAEIVTAGGLVLAHPTEDTSSTTFVPHALFDWSGSEIDYAEWDALAVVLMGRLEKSWVFLKAWPGTTHMPVADYNALVELLNDIRKRYAEMRKPWHTNELGYGLPWTGGMPGIAWDATDDVGKMTGLVIDIQCLRQRIDEALASLGGTPDTPGNTAHKPPAEGLGILGTIALVVGGGAVATGLIILARKVGK